MIDSSQRMPEASLVAVDRAAAELRRGHFVIIVGSGEAVLAQAAECVTRESLATLRRLGNGDALLALTPERAAVLKMAVNGAAVAILPITASASIDTVLGFADPTYRTDAPSRRPIGLASASSESCASVAVELSKIAKLLPAALTAPLPPGALSVIEPVAAPGGLLRVRASAILDYPKLAAATLRPVAEARVPLEAAESARVVGFRPADGSVEQFAILIGEPEKHQPPLCRLHSECFTGDLLGSLRCDCGPQLQNALLLMGQEGHGVVLYLAQEGRGIGLINKLRAYQLQDSGLDTVDANQHLGFEPDERSFQAAAVMLRHLGITSVRLMTNNPAKVEALIQEGIDVVERVPHATAPTRHNREYLLTKAIRSGHLLGTVPQA